MQKLKVLDLFSGIGGFSLGLERTGGFETVAFCEIDPFCQKVLKKHWPDVPIYNDVRELNYDGPVDVITGGFPCQDISVAGSQKGIGEGTRSGLWSELCGIIGGIRPKYAIMENVTNLLNGQGGAWFGRVLGDLAEIGYDAEWHCIPASLCGAPHIRDRIWILAYPPSKRWALLQDQKTSCVAWERLSHLLKSEYRWERKAGGHSPECVGWILKPEICGSDDDVPATSYQLKALGNAVVPQIPEIIGHAILQAEGITI